MKTSPKFLMLSALLLAFSPIFSQTCSSDSLLLYNTGDMSYVQPGFIDPHILPCVSNSNYSELVIPFKTYHQGARLLTLPDSSEVPVSTVYSMHIESISNLPSGLCWITRPSSQTISGDTVGVLIIKGTTTASFGTYPLSIQLSLDVQGNNSFTYTGLNPWNYSAILGQVILKVMGSDNICPTIN